MPLGFTIFLLIFLLFVQFLWISTDKLSFSQFISETQKGNRSRTFLFIFFIIVLQIITGILIPFPIYHYGMIFILAGLALYELGMALIIWAKFSLQGNWGVPGEHNIRYQKKLITSGPFALSRNPIYLGLLIITFGFGITVQSYLALLFIPLYFYFMGIIKQEEAVLLEHFGQEYIEYKKKVHRFI